tara:strand:- start:4405 stop:4755 length:351 start_codon:yes stop_codon:yes gene_type:complete
VRDEYRGKKGHVYALIVKESRHSKLMNGQMIVNVMNPEWQKRNKLSKKGKKMDKGYQNWDGNLKKNMIAVLENDDWRYMVVVMDPGGVVNKGLFGRFSVMSPIFLVYYFQYRKEII